MQRLLLSAEVRGQVSPSLCDPIASLPSRLLVPAAGARSYTSLALH